VKHSLRDSFKVYGIVKPGTCVESLTTSLKYDIEQLTNSDAVIFWGGSNDVSKNNSRHGLRHVVDFVSANSHTNIILVSVPKRYDLCDWSCVNSEVKSFNRKLCKSMKSYDHVKMINVDDKREYFTSHGFHMNNNGKEITALSIVNTIISLFHKQKTSPIKVGWTVDREEGSRVTSCEDSPPIKDVSSSLASSNDSVNHSERGSYNHHPLISSESEMNKSMSCNRDTVSTRPSKLLGTRSEVDKRSKPLILKAMKVFLIKY
jgi:hypothetical protein